MSHTGSERVSSKWGWGYKSSEPDATDGASSNSAANWGPGVQMHESVRSISHSDNHNTYPIKFHTLFTVLNSTFLLHIPSQTKINSQLEGEWNPRVFYPANLRASETNFRVLWDAILQIVPVTPTDCIVSLKPHIYKMNRTLWMPFSESLLWVKTWPVLTILPNSNAFARQGSFHLYPYLTIQALWPI